jgi:hypothetical protein
MNRLVCLIFLALMLLASVSVAQQPVKQSAPPGKTEDQPGLTAKSLPGGQQGQRGQQGMGQMQGMELTQNMDKMATTVTRMAEICEQMMKKEMAAMPYKLAAGISLGVLVTVVLLLLVVLEVQWIIYWSQLLKEQKRRS